MIRYHARLVLPVARPAIERGTVAVREGRIAYVGPTGRAPAGIDVDLGNVALVPGLVNAHTHLELTAMRGFLEELPFQQWILRLTRARRDVMDDARLLDSARWGLVEGLRAGITTYGDTCSSGVVLRALKEAGARGIMYQEVFGPDPKQCADAVRDLDERVRTLRIQETPLVKVGVSPHAPYSVSDALFAATADLARRERLPVAVHVAESADEDRYVREGSGPFADMQRARDFAFDVRGTSPVAALEPTGVLAMRALLIHAVRVDADDIARIARHGCAVAHCPASNAKLGHGIAPLVELLAAGVAVGLGSDSVASNNRMDVLEEARLAALFQRARTGDPTAISARQALELATLGGARALGLEREVGSLEEGKAADLAAFPLGGAGDPRAVPWHEPEAALVFAMAGARASFVAVQGEVLLREGRLRREDAELPRRVQQSADALRAWLAADRGAAHP
jgi:cytosine/adenosine deaminase-related metal-dependent hydrolase